MITVKFDPSRINARLQGVDRAVKETVREAAQAGAQARFAREIAILARLAHPSIVTVLDAGHIDADTPFFAMPVLAGRTLADEVAAGRSGRETLLATIPAISDFARPFGRDNTASRYKRRPVTGLIR